jgi:DNA-3-methyladenine glycosylase
VLDVLGDFVKIRHRALSSFVLRSSFFSSSFFVPARRSGYTKLSGLIDARPIAVSPSTPSMLCRVWRPLEEGAQPLPRSFFARDALVVARALIGCRLVHERAGSDARVSRIVETEAYRGPRDLACHARAGLTRRTRTLLGPEGHAYVFFIYGMHDCFNATCFGEGRGHAVLVRAGEPTAGFDHGTRLDGPGRFAKAMGITRSLDGHDLTERPLVVLPRQGRVRIGVSARVGVAYAGVWADKPWRFFDSTSPHVSKPPRSAIGGGGR